MPYVNVKVTPDGVTAERKRRIIAGITEVPQTVLDKDPEITMVVIDEVEADNWGLGGESVTHASRAGAAPMTVVVLPIDGGMTIGHW